MSNLVSTLQEYSQFPQVQSVSYSSPVTLKAKWSEVPPLLTIPDPQTGEPDMGLRSLTPVKGTLQYNYFPVGGA